MVAEEKIIEIIHINKFEIYQKLIIIKMKSSKFLINKIYITKNLINKVFNMNGIE